MERLPVQDEAGEKIWKDNLSLIIKQMRATNATRDANAIAIRIADFRREFLGDATKVLNLG